MPQTPITSANMTAAVVKLFSNKIPLVLGANLVMGGLVNRSYDDAPGNIGNLVHVPLPPASMTANDLSEGGDVVAQATNMGGVDIPVTTHKEVTFTIPDITQMVTNFPLFMQYVDRAVADISEAVEGDLFGLYTGLTTNAAVGAGSTAIVRDVVEAAETALFTSRVPKTSPKYLVVNGGTYKDLRKIPDFTEVAKIGPNASVASGALGEILGMQVFRSQLVKTVVGTPTTTYNLAFAPDAVTLVSRRFAAVPAGLGVISEDIDVGGFRMQLVHSYNADKLAHQFTIHILYGVSVLRKELGVVVKS